MKAIINKEISNEQDSKLFWQDHIKAWKASGLLKAQYCKKHELSYARLMYWQKRINETQEGSLIPVAVKETSALDQAKIFCSVKLSNGLLLQIHDLSVLDNIFSKLNIV